MAGERFPLRSSIGCRATPPHIENTLAPDEIITAIDLPPNPYAEHSVYTKLRDRASYAFALVSVAALLDLDGDTVRSARLALGGVAHKPWRLPEAEALLAGKAATKENFLPVAKALFAGAHGYEHNAFKIELGQRAVVRALQVATHGTASIKGVNGQKANA